jgi:hypothetical protein
MNRTQLEHIIRAASEISGDSEIVVIGSQAIHALRMELPPIAFQSDEADVYARNYPERADERDAAIGELSPFHDTHGSQQSCHQPLFSDLGHSASWRENNRKIPISSDQAARILPR